MRVAGIGCRKGAAVQGLADLVTAGGVERLATIAARGDEVGALAAALNLPLRLIPEEELRGVETPTQSARVVARFGTGSVAEAVALRAAGSGARIVQARITLADGLATMAIAEGDGA